MKKLLLIFTVAVMPLCALHADGYVTPPADAAVTYCNDEFGVSWVDADTDTVTPVSFYAVYRSTAPQVSGTYYDVSFTATSPFIVDSGINTYTPYYYRLSAVDVSGNASAMSVSMCSYPLPPASFSAQPYNSKVMLNWSKSPVESVTLYNIYRKSSSRYSAHAQEEPGGKYTDENAVNLIDYYYRISSLSGTEGSCSCSVTAKPFAPPFEPAAPGASITIDTGGTTLAVLTWSRPGKSSYEISGYNIYRSVVYGDDTDFSDFTTSTAYADAVPNTGTLYYYMVKTRDVEGNLSYPAYVEKFIQGPPSRPQSITVTAYTCAGGSLSWAANYTGETVTGYAVYRNGSYLTVNSGNTFTDSGLTPGDVYSYYIYALNGYGPSAGSSEAVTITAYPAVPVGATATAGLPGEIDLSWSTASGAENITIYNIYRASSPGTFDMNAPLSTTPTTSFIDATAPTGSGIFYYRVVAVTESAGNTIMGRYSPDLAARPVTLAAQPDNLTATAFNSYIRLGWTYPASDYGVTSFNIYRSTDGAAYVTIGASANDYFYNYSLANGTGYFYKISAVNKYGESALSAAAPVTPVSSAAYIEAPKNVTVSANDNGTVYLDWDASRNEDAVTGYNVYRSLTSGSYGAAYGSLTNTYLTDNPAAGTQYYYSVQAFGLTVSALSAEVSIIPFVRPPAPENVAVADLYKKVLLTWDAPEDPYTYFSGTTKYNVYRSTTYSGTYTALTSTTLESYYDTAVNTGTSYYYKVKTVDDNGNEDSSTAAYYIMPVNFMAGPVTLVAVSGDGFVTLIWRKSLPNYYNIYRREASGTYSTPIAYGISSNTKEYTDTTVVNGTVYYYTMTAVNGAGEGEKLGEIIAEPYKAAFLPADPAVRVTMQNKKDVLLEWNQAVAGDYAILGYNVYRSSDNGGTYALLTFVADSAAPSYFDNTTVWDNKYYYLIKTVDAHNNEDASYPVVSVDLPMPKNKLRVFANMLNLAEGETLKLKYLAVESGKVKIKIHTLSGEFVKTVFEGETPDGATALAPYESPDIIWDGTNTSGKKVASGVYLIMLEFKNSKVVEKVAVIK